eukprot:10470482-Alexandrium_andersonii.AAC.1
MAWNRPTAPGPQLQVPVLGAPRFARRPTPHGWVLKLRGLHPLARSRAWRGSFSPLARLRPQ